MDPFSHTLVGLTTAKAGLERLSPLATTVCVLAANSPDSDVIVGLTTDRWNYLQHHRGITHSLVGVLALAIIVPSIVWVAERGFARLRRIQPRARYRGLLLASVIATATHPLMDWTNNYGLRPFLPWSARWFYGDLVFIVDPYILLVAGGAAFLATNKRWFRTWAILAIGFVVLSFIFGARAPGLTGVAVARAILLVGVAVLILVRALGIARGRERSIATAALAVIVVYWGGLTLVHRNAYHQAKSVADQTALEMNENVIRVAAMPTLANPVLWSCVAESDKAIYRYEVKVGTAPAGKPPPVIDGYQTTAPEAIERYEKPTGRAAEFASLASQDRRAEILMGFARFPIARVPDQDCISQTIVQFADLRYTEPGAQRGTFSVNVPVDCASK